MLTFLLLLTRTQTRAEKYLTISLFNEMRHRWLAFPKTVLYSGKG